MFEGPSRPGAPTREDKREKKELEKTLQEPQVKKEASKNLKLKLEEIKRRKGEHNGTT